jgi:enoyl-CoA hydratase
MSPTPARPVAVEVDAEGVAVLTLCRPEAHNALTQDLVGEVHAALHALEDREDLRALVLAGAGGKAFAAGADVGEMRNRRRADAWKGINAGLFARVEAFPRPTVAAVEGFCLGGGLELALACDFRVAGTSARMGQPEVSLGIMAAAGATRRLPALIGLGPARRLLFTGEVVVAEEALRLGLVDLLVPDGTALARARAFLVPILRQAPEAVRRTKRALLAWVHGAGEEALRRLDADLQADLLEHPDKFARMDAFLARKRGSRPAPSDR